VDRPQGVFGGVVLLAQVAQHQMLQPVLIDPAHQIRRLGIVEMTQLPRHAALESGRIGSGRQQVRIMVALQHQGVTFAVGAHHMGRERSQIRQHPQHALIRAKDVLTGLARVMGHRDRFHRDIAHPERALRADLVTDRAVQTGAALADRLARAERHMHRQIMAARKRRHALDVVAVLMGYHKRTQRPGRDLQTGQAFFRFPNPETAVEQYPGIARLDQGGVALAPAAQRSESHS